VTQHPCHDYRRNNARKYKSRSGISVDQVVFPPLDRSAGCLPLLIISNNGYQHSSQNDADVVQMGS
jgi:hypothetical protein